jgi:hypothetical protein
VLLDQLRLILVVLHSDFLSRNVDFILFLELYSSGTQPFQLFFFCLINNSNIPVMKSSVQMCLYFRTEDEKAEVVIASNEVKIGSIKKEEIFTYIILPGIGTIEKTRVIHYNLEEEGLSQEKCSANEPLIDFHPEVSCVNLVLSQFGQFNVLFS